MRIGLLVDGQAEYQSLPRLVPGITLPHAVLAPLYCAMQPLSSPGQIAHVASKRFPLLLQRHVDRIVILIDKEHRDDCPGEFATAIATAARQKLSALSTSTELAVVVKVSRYENWLVADPAALGTLPGRFKEVERIGSRVSGGRADSVDGLTLLKQSAQGKSFDKVRDAIAICQKLSPDRARKNSASFDKFIRVLESR